MSIRDILTWVQFINTCSKTVDMEVAMETGDTYRNQLDTAVAYIHGACLVFLDGLGAGKSIDVDIWSKIRKYDNLRTISRICMKLFFIISQVCWCFVGLPLKKLIILPQRVHNVAGLGNGHVITPNIWNKLFHSLYRLQ